MQGYNVLANEQETKTGECRHRAEKSTTLKVDHCDVVITVAFEEGRKDTLRAFDCK